MTTADRSDQLQSGTRVRLNYGTRFSAGFGASDDFASGTKGTVHAARNDIVTVRWDGSERFYQVVLYEIDVLSPLELMAEALEQVNA